MRIRYSIPSHMESNMTCYNESISLNFPCHHNESMKPNRVFDLLNCVKANITFTSNGDKHNNKVSPYFHLGSIVVNERLPPAEWT